LRNKILTAVSMPEPFDRIVQLDFALRPSEAAELRLFCEVQGRYSNAILTDGNNTVLLAARQVGAAQSSVRLIRVGEQYTPPPLPDGMRPSLSESLENWKGNVSCAEGLLSIRGPTLAAAMARSYQGMSPGLARELCCSAGLEPSASSAALSNAEWAELYATWQSWIRRLHAGDFVATRDPSGGTISMLGAFVERHESVQSCIDLLYRETQAKDRFTALHARLLRANSKAAKSAQGKLQALKKQLHASEGADTTQFQGDLIMANVHRWPAGAPSLEAEDWNTGWSPERLYLVI
jgi:predicted ribosome quality control (RQC) complex YloA/Tae2 family protein